MMLAQQLYEGIELPGSTARSVSSPTCEPTRCASRSRRSTAVREHIGTHVRRRLSAGEAERLQDEGRRAGRARGDSPDLAAIRSGNGAAASHAGSVFASTGLIWNRFVASQMPPATFDETTVDITAADYLFRVKGTVPKFAGWMATYDQETPRPRPTDPARRGSSRGRGRQQRAAAARAKATARARRRCGPSRSSRSRRRASPKRRWSRSSKKTASAGRAPTPRSSACCRSATT